MNGCFGEVRDAAAVQRTGAVGTGCIGGEITRSVKLDEAAAVPARAATAGADGSAAVGTDDLKARITRPGAVAVGLGADAWASAKLEAAHAARPITDRGSARKRSPGASDARASVRKRK